MKFSSRLGQAAGGTGGGGAFNRGLDLAKVSSKLILEDGDDLLI